MADDATLAQVLAVWSDVLGVPDIRPDDDFFELGGDSLAVVRALTGLETTLGITLSARTLLETRTARAMTARLSR